MGGATIRRWILSITILATAGCVEEFNPRLEFQVQDIMVVDSYLNATTQSAKVLLSYPFEAGRDTINRIETGAAVRIESEEGNSFTLSERSPGRYESHNLAVDMNALYRLHFSTADGRDYISDFVPVTKTPPIDSVTWGYHAPELDVHGIHIMVNTKGISDDDVNFLWDYEETWEYTADYFSEYKYVNRKVVDRPYNERIYVCYRTDASFNILLGSTEILSKPVVSNHPLLWISGGSRKLYKKYSILVRQRSITKDAYEYWSRLKATTEDLGGLFDPPLSQVKGNIINSNNPGATVVGYFGAGQVSEKRMFIRLADLPENILAIRRGGLCGGEDTKFIPLDEESQLTTDQVPVQAIYSHSGGLLGYIVSTVRCADCRWQGGVLTPPAFW